MKRLGAVAVGAAAGTAFAPGPGTFIGGLAGWVMDQLGLSSRNKKRAFVSFDYDHDVALKNLLVGQTRNGKTPFEIVDGSLQEAAPEHDWETHAESAIADSDLVLVLVGSQTYRARGVLKEIKIAKKLGVPVVQIASERYWTAPKIRGAGRRYLWRWPDLKHVLE